MAAQQAGELYEKAKIHVIPSKNIGTGYVALSSIDFDNPGVDANVDAMTAAIARVTAGYVSPSIRDTDMNGLHIHNGDTIGIIEKDIVVSEKERSTATCKLASMLVELPDKFMLTVFCGKDTVPEEWAALEDHMKKNHTDIELYFVDGGQEIYPYIFVAE